MRRTGMRVVGAFVGLGLCVFSGSALRAAPPPNPRVGIMPGYPNSPHCDPSAKRKVRPGVPVIVWGNANGGGGTANGLAYAISFTPNPNVSVTAIAPPLTGTITNDRYIYEEVTFTLLGGSTNECITAKLAVTFPGPVVLSKTVDIWIIAPTDPMSTAPLDNLQINVDIAIEDGLRALYLMQSPTGAWIGTGGAQGTCAATGFALWAFQNQGHLASNPQGDDIYAEFVERGLDSILAAAVAGGTAATNADVPRGAVANGVSDLNSNARSINLCPGPGTAYYSSPIAAAAIIASLEPTRIVSTGPFTADTFQTVLEDVIDWIGTVQNAVSATGPRGGWYYFAGTPASDMSISSWYYLALEGVAIVGPPCNNSGGGGGIAVPDWIKQEAEYALIYHQNNAAGPQPFGYQSSFPLQGPADGFATTSGGLSGLALVQTESVGLPVQDIIDNEPAPLNSIATKRQAALDYLGTNWHNTVNASFLGFANRGNFYAMWTTARALRITAKALSLPAGAKVPLWNGGVKFDWETGETLNPTPMGNVPPALDPREGYFPFLVRNQDTVSGPTTRGRWNMGTFLTGEGASFETSMGVLILINRVFGPSCQIACPEDITVRCEGNGGAIVNFNVTTSGCPDGTTVVCVPPSGSFFPVGVTQVQCYAQEPCGNRRSLPCCFKVTVVEPCACSEVKDKRIECSRTGGAYTYTFDVTNLSGVDVSRIKLLPCDMDGDFLPDFTMTPDTINLGTPLPNGQTTSVTVTITGANPKKPACFEVWLFDKEFKRCCVVKHCVDLPECCLDIVNAKVECDPVVPGQYLYTFQVRNNAPFTVDRFFLWPPFGVTMTPSSFILPPLATGQTSAPLSVIISGAAPGSTICFDTSIHESKTDECCYEQLCIDLPDCNPCKVEDICELPKVTTLCREQGAGLELLTATIKLTICNYCNDHPTEFMWSLDGHVDPLCPVPFLTAANFTPSSGVTPPLKRGECVTIPITITSSFAQFPSGSKACFKATITNLATAEMFCCIAGVKSPKVNSIKIIVADPVDPVEISKGRIRPVSFQVTNQGTTAVAASLAFSDGAFGETDSGALRLNGLPPGQPVRMTVNLPAGGTSQVAVEVSFAVHAPLGIFRVVASSVDSKGVADPLASVGVTSVDPNDCNQNGVPDDVDILLCNSEDKDHNGIPDECAGIPLAPSSDSFVRGDSNGDSVLNVSDGLSILDYLYGGSKAPTCDDAADVNDSGRVDMADAVGILSYLFMSGVAPAAPFEECGLDPTPDALGCSTYLPCN